MLTERVDAPVDEIEAEQEFGRQSRTHERLDGQCTVEKCRLRRARRNRAGVLDAMEADHCSRSHLRETAEIRTNDRCDLGIPAGRLPVGHLHDRLALAGHLDCAHGDSVGNDSRAQD